MPEIEHIEDHEEHAQALFIDQFQEKQRIAALLASYTAEIQAAEDMLWDVRVKRFLDAAEGAQLDAIGRIVGEPRNDRTDTIYRVLLLVRIALNRSDGHADDVIRCLQMLRNTEFTNSVPFTFVLEDYFPASFDVDVFDFTPSVGDADAADVLAHIVRSARAAGVRGAALISTFGDEPDENPEAYPTYSAEDEAVADDDAVTCLLCYSSESLPGPLAGVYE